MGNTLLTPSIIAKEALMLLKNNMVMGNLVYRDYETEFAKPVNGNKPGSTITIRRPVQFIVSNGATRTNQDVVELSTSLVVNSRKHVSWNFNTQDLTLTIDQYTKRYLNSAMLSLANQVDYDLCGLFTQVPKAVGTPGTTPNSFATSVQLVGQKLDEVACPKDDRRLVNGPAAHWSLAGGLLSLYQPVIVKDVKEGAALGRFGGFDTFMDQNIQSQTAGVAAGFTASVTVDTSGGVADGTTSFTVTNSTGSNIAFNVGDVITIAGIYEANPVSKQALTYLKQLTVTAATGTIANSGTATLSFAPALYAGSGQSGEPGPQNCSVSSTANNKVVTMAASHVANIAFHKNAFALAMVPLELPDGAPFKARQSYDGLSVRVIKDYDVTNDIEIIRLDILYGVKTIYPELAVRLMG